MLDKVIIKSHIKIEYPYYILTLHHPEMAAQAKPGQFVMITPHSTKETQSSFYLKRPISIFDIDKENGDILIYYQVSGMGTEYMTQLQVGDEVSVIAPLGRGFRTTLENEKILLVGAGVGIAPFKYLYDTLKHNNEVHCLFSGRDANALKYTSYFGQLEHVYIATDTGELGIKSNAVELTKEVLKNQEKPFTFIYSCGPPIVLKHIGLIAQEYNLPGQLSLEGRMGCGIRACQACTISTKMGPQKVCGFGPVFDIQNLILEEL